MVRFIYAFAVVFLCLLFTSNAQDVSITASLGFGPFVNSADGVNTFELAGIPSGAVVDSVQWQIVCHDGPNGALRVVRSAKTATPSWQTNMRELPFAPRPTLIALANYSVNSIRVSRQAAATILMVAPTITWTATNNWAPIRIGSQFSGQFGVRGCPPGTTRIAFYLQPTLGGPIDSLIRNGSNLDSASFQYRTSAHSGSLLFHAYVTFPGAPAGGYLIARQILDSLPNVRVNSSLGFGPFISGRNALTIFTIDSTFGSYSRVVFRFGLNGRYGARYRVDSISVPWTRATDRFQTTVNMGDLPPFATLLVNVIDPDGRTVATQVVPISVQPPTNEPVFTMHRQPPLVYQESGADSIVVDSIPARTVRSRIEIISADGEVQAESNETSAQGAFLRRASIHFDGGSLPLFTHTLRATFWSNYKQTPTVFEFYFNVLDTSRPEIIATSFGPFVQTDSASFSVGVTDVRPNAATLTKRFGWFQIVDTETDVVLAKSDTVDLKQMKRTDSLWWGDELDNRTLLQAASLPVNASIQFVDVGELNNSIVFEDVTTHPLLIVPNPGVLSASAGYGPFITGRNVFNVFRIDSLPSDVRAVEFAVSGTENPSEIDSLMVTNFTNGSAQFATNMGMLPINSRLRVTVWTESGFESGTTLERFLHVVPDSLFMQSALNYENINLNWETLRFSIGTGITGVRTSTDTLTFSRLPAQTERITVKTLNDLDRTIDSVSADVPYRLRFDAGLVVRIPLPIRSLSTSRLVVQIATTGGSEEGIEFSYPVVVRKPTFNIEVRRVAPSGTLDANSVRQGSTDVLDLTTRVILSGTNSAYGFSSVTGIDSTRIRILDCRGNVLATFNPVVARSSPRSNVISTIMTSVASLPLTTTRAEVTIYSTRLGFPKSGFTYSDTVRIVPFPSYSVQFRGDFPTYRINDTVSMRFDNRFTIADLPLVDSVVDIRVVSKTNNVVARFPNRIPVRDSVDFVIDMSSSSFAPEGSPYRVLAAASYTVCNEQRIHQFALDTFTTSRVFHGTSSDFFLWSSAGWGPFQQGRSQSTAFMFGIRPSVLIQPRNPAFDDELRIRIRSFTANRDSVQWTYLDSTWLLRRNASAPDQIRFRASEMQIGGLRPGSWINVNLAHTWANESGRSPRIVLNYWFPIEMLPFVLRTLSSTDGFGPFEQSVSAGSAGQQSMSRRISIIDTVNSDIVSRIPLVITDDLGNKVEEQNMQAGEFGGSGVNRFQVFRFANFEVAQFPWPRISRDHRNMIVELEYYFQGNNLRAAAQDQRIAFTPRAEWLNGSIVVVTAVRDTLVDLTVTTPLPTDSWTRTLPLIGRQPFRMGDANGRMAIVHRVTYNTRNGTFAFQPSDAQHSATWTYPPWLNDLGVFQLVYKVVAANGATDDMFVALRQFEPDLAGHPNRNLRLRALMDAKFTFSPTTFFTVLEAAFKILARIKSAPAPVISFVPTFYLNMGTQQLLLLNMGVDSSDQLTHMGTIPAVRNARRIHQNTYPTSLSMAQIFEVSFGGEIQVCGFLGWGISLNNILRMNDGVAFQGPISNVKNTQFPGGITYRLFLVVDFSAFWGLLRRELFRGQLAVAHSPHGTPTFEIFRQRYVLFIPGLYQYHGFSKDSDWKPGDVVQEETLTNEPLPQETPVYYSNPSIDATDSAVVLVWTEHAMRTNRGAVVLGRVNSDSMLFNTEAIVTENPNGVHHPMVRLLNNDGTSLVVWNENSSQSSMTEGGEFDSVTIARLLRTEDLHAAIVNGQNEVVKYWTLGSDLSSVSARVDGNATIAVAEDGMSAIVVWPVQFADDTLSDIVAVLFRLDNGEWNTDSTKLLGSTSGFDDFLDVMPINTNEFVVAGRTSPSMNSTVGQAQINSWHYNGSWSDATVLYTEQENTNINAVSVDGNGQYGVLALITSQQADDSSEVELTLQTFEFTNGWQLPEKQTLNGANANVRALDVTVDDDGEASVFADLTYAHRDTNGIIDDGRDIRNTYTFTSNGVAGGWTSTVNSASLFESVDRVWSMSSANGPNDVIYVVGQELDSIYGNIQTYDNGIQVGPARLNTVLHAFRYEGDSLVSVPFDKSNVVDVYEDPIEKNLRYPSTLFDPYPNPTSGEGSLPFVVMQKTNVLIDVIDVAGKVVLTLVNSELNAGRYEIQIPTSTLPQGCFTIRMLAGTGDLMIKNFVVIK